MKFFFAILYCCRILLFPLFSIVCVIHADSQIINSSSRTAPAIYQESFNPVPGKNHRLAAFPSGLVIQPLQRTTDNVACNTSTFFMHLTAGAGEKLDLKNVQTLPNGNFILAGNRKLPNNEQEGLICILTNGGSIVVQKQLRLNNRPLTLSAMKIFPDGNIAVAGIVHSVPDSAFVSILNPDLSVSWLKLLYTPAAPSKLSLHLVENDQIAVAMQLPLSIIYSLFNNNGTIAWNKQMSPAGLDELVGFTQINYSELGLEINCTRAGKKTVEIIRINQLSGAIITSHTMGNGTDENKYSRSTSFYNRMITAGVVKNASGQYKLVRNIMYSSATSETEHTYTVPGNVDFSTTCALDNAGDIVAYSLPADGKLVFIRQLASYQTSPEYSRQYTVPVGSSIAGVARSFTDGGFLLGLNSADGSDLILIKTDSIGRLAGCSYADISNNYTETIQKSNTASASTSSDIVVPVSAAAFSVSPAILNAQFDCTQNFCPPPPPDDTCLSSYYKILRSNSFADIFGAYYLVRNNHQICITVRYDHILANQNLLTYGVKLFDERGDFIKGVQVFCDNTSVPVLSRQVDDQHIMLVCYTVRSGVPCYTFTLIDDDLQVIWSRSIQTFTGFNFVSDGLMGSLIKDEEGNFYFFGNNLGFNENPKVLAYKMDPNGNPIWLKIHQFQSGLFFFNIAGTTTHSSLVMVVEGSNTGSVSLRLDKLTGQFQNAFVFQNGSAGAIYQRHLQFNNDRIFYAGNNGNSDLAIGTFDTTGRPIKIKHLLNRPSSIMRAAASAAGKLYVMYNYYAGSGYKDVLMKTDSLLDVEYSNDFDVVAYGYPVGMGIAADGSVYVGGNYFYGGGNGYADPYFRKFDPAGLSGTCAYQTSVLSFTEPNLNITPLMTTVSSQTFTPITIPMLFVPDTNGQRISTVLCASVSQCNSISLSGPAIVCGLNQSKTYTTTANPGCTIQPVWIYDTSFVVLQTVTSSLVSIQFKRTGNTWIKVKLSSGCSTYYDSLYVQIQDSPASLNLGNDKPICSGDSVRLHAPNGFASYQWQDGSTDSVFIATTPGQYFVQVSNLCNETYADTIVLSPVLVPALQIGNDSSVCKKDTLFIKASTGFSNYSWQSSATVNGQGQQVFIVPLQNTDVTVVATTIEGCRAYDTVHITSIQARPVFLGSDTSLCGSDSLRLDAGTNYLQYNWSTGSNQASIYVHQTGSYHVQAKDTNGCIAKDTLKIVQVFSLPVFSIGNDFSLCMGEQKRLDPGPFNQYSWQDGSTNRYFTVTIPGNYWVKVTDVNQCSAYDSVRMINILPAPAGFLKPVDSICQYDKITIGALANFADYSWSTGSSQPAIIVQTPGLYSLTVHDGNGCAGSENIKIVQKYCYSGIYIPTAFTPNGDQLNDVFNARVYGPVLSFRLRVYNRYGELVFMTEDPAKGWDGKYKGVMQSSDVFVWHCYYHLPGKSPATQKGTVTLIH